MYANKAEGVGHVMRKFAYKLFKIKYLAHKLYVQYQMFCFLHQNTSPA